jgi:hypothetical protein
MLTMEKEKASIRLPDGSIIERTVTSVLKPVGPLCIGVWNRSVQYAGKKCRVEECDGDSQAKYVLKARSPTEMQRRFASLRDCCYHPCHLSSTERKVE